MSSKERLILEAVNSLADEGKQLYDITVSEIAARAGVGKGTVYEYFVTKDEIISKAVAYKILSEGLETEKRIRAEKTLQEKFFTAIDCVYNNARECMITCMITISALTARLGLDAVWQYTPESQEEFRKLRDRILDDMILAAAEEGLGSVPTAYGRMAVISALIGASAGILSDMQDITQSKETAYQILVNAWKGYHEQDSRAI